VKVGNYIWSRMNISPESFQKIMDWRAKPTCLGYNTEVVPKENYFKKQKICSQTGLLLMDRVNPIKSFRMSPTILGPKSRLIPQHTEIHLNGWPLPTDVLSSSRTMNIMFVSSLLLLIMQHNVGLKSLFWKKVADTIEHNLYLISWNRKECIITYILPTNEVLTSAVEFELKSNFIGCELNPYQFN